jgi:GDP-D-mannose dehydratase
VDWNSGAQAHAFIRSASCPRYSWGQNLTDATVGDPDEVYNLGAQSHVKVSCGIPEYTAEVVAVGTLRPIEALRDHNLHGGRPVRFYQAGSSEMFGATRPPAKRTELL